MTSITSLKMSKDDLKNYAIVFSPQSNERFFQDYFYRLSRKDRDSLLGYEPKSPRASCSYKAIKIGRYPAPRIKIMCAKEKIDPKKIRTEYETSVETMRKHKYSPLKVDKFTEDLIWEAMGDGL